MTADYVYRNNEESSSAGTFVAKEAYDNGANSVTISSIEKVTSDVEGNNVLITVKATASNGKELEDTVIGSGYDIYIAGEAAGKIKYEPTTISATSSYSGNNEYAVTITAKNAAGTTVGTESHTVDARDAYDDGYTDGAKEAAKEKVTVTFSPNGN
jgi:hypothetical protein